MAWSSSSTDFRSSFDCGPRQTLSAPFFPCSVRNLVVRPFLHSFHSFLNHFFIPDDDDSIIPADSFVLVWLDTTLRIIIINNNGLCRIAAIQKEFATTTTTTQEYSPPKTLGVAARVAVGGPSLSSSAVLFSLSGTTTTVVEDETAGRNGATSFEKSPQHHVVSGIDCREVTIPNILSTDNHIDNGSITILEATAAAQDQLVDLALEEDGDEGALLSSLPKEEALSLPTGDPYGAVLWPAAAVVARVLMRELQQEQHNQQEQQNNQLKKKITVLELGAGTGLVSIAATRSGFCEQVIATDYEQIPLLLLQYAAQHLNGNVGNRDDDDDDSEDNTPPSSSTRLSCQLLDMCQHEEQPLPLPKNDHSKNNNNSIIHYVVAADVMYQPSTGRAVASRVVEALQQNATVILGDSPGRAGRPAFLQELRRRVQWKNDDTREIDFTNVSGETVTGPRNELICGPESSTISQGDVPKELTVAILKLDPSECEILSVLANDP